MKKSIRVLADASSAAGAQRAWVGVQLGTRLIDTRSIHVAAPPSAAFAPIRRIGGEQGWTGTSPVADTLAVTWWEFAGVIRDHYTRFRIYWIPSWMALCATAAASAALSWRRQPTIMTPGSVIGFNLNLPVEPGLVWRDLGVFPRYPTVHEGIPAALEECVAFRWRHPVFDRKSW